MIAVTIPVHITACEEACICECITGMIAATIPVHITACEEACICECITGMIAATIPVHITANPVRKHASVNALQG